MQVTYYVAASLDGFIAKPDGGLDWLENSGLNMDDSGYEDLFATVDAIVMGRGTYDMILSFGEWPYGDLPTWICSHREISPMSGMNLQPETDPTQVVAEASKMGCQRLWLVGGGNLVTTLINHNLLTDISLTLMPVLLGEGVPLVGILPNHKMLKLEKSRQGHDGFMQLDYIVLQHP